MDLNELKAQIKEMAGIDVDGLINKVQALTEERDTAIGEAQSATAALSDVIGERSTSEAKAAIAAGEAYRKDLTEQVVNHRRQLGLTGDTDEAKAAAEGMYAGFSLEQLKAEAEALGSKAGGTEQLQPAARQEEGKTPGRKRFRKAKPAPAATE